MSNVKKKLKSTIGDASTAAKKAVDNVVEKSKAVAHEAGKKIEQGGKKLQDV